MKATEFDAKFDRGEDITEFLDLSQASLPGHKQKRQGKQGKQRRQGKRELALIRTVLPRNPASPIKVNVRFCRADTTQT